MDKENNPILSIIKEFDDIYLIGLSGSAAKNESDSLSDIDYAVIVKNSIPAKRKREKVYKNLDDLQLKYFDVDFEVSRSDGISYKETHFDILWMRHSKLIKFLSELNKNITCDEFLPGGILKLCPLQGYEKQHELILQLIKYSDVRSIKRVQSFLNKIHFHMYTLKWLDKAIIRNDYYSFNKHSQQCIDDIITVLYSLNKQWYSEEKRLLSIIDSFQLAPDNISNRLESIIMRKNDNRDMSQCILNLKTVISEISTIAKIKFMDYAVY